MKNIANKMIQVMEKVSYIQKNGYNSHFKYKYASDEDISNAFSKAFKEVGIVWIPSIIERTKEVIDSEDKYKKNRKEFFTQVKMKFIYIDSESGESIESVFYGDGVSSDDKGIYKAITGAVKYVLLKTFLVPTGDDAEKNNENFNSEEDQKSVIYSKDEVAMYELLTQKLKKICFSEGAAAFREEWKILSPDEKKYLTQNQFVTEFKKLCDLHAVKNISGVVPVKDPIKKEEGV